MALTGRVSDAELVIMRGNRWFSGLVVAALLAGCQSAPPAGVMRTPESRFAGLVDFPYTPRYHALPWRDGRIRMHYIDEGPRDAPVILCLHGQGQWSWAYHRMIPLFLAAGYRVVAPDFIGFGRSDKLPADTDYEFADHVAWLATFIAEMDLGNDVTAFMFDWGGYFGLRIAAEQPALFDRLVLANTLLPRGNSGGSAFFRKWRAGILARPVFPMAQMVEEGTKTRLDADALAAYDAPFPDERYKTGPRRFPLIVPIDDADTAAPDNKAAWQALAGFDKPVLTIYSRMFAGSASLGPAPIIGHIPGAIGQPHALIDDASFYIVDDAPEELARRTLAFIEAR